MAGEAITGVAMLCDDGRVWALPRPCRHHHVFSLAAFMQKPVDPCRQGFMTSAGRFVTREEAMGIVRANGGPWTTSDTGRRELFSEDVW